ncbi:hypothetical protein E2C01_026764 [Portunus trituberculatus]|uniref:Uncharacterized protein n=1 Tax=Portunus trituberculatus TaxID=210409 RepID=A0A5B7EJ22_PORTR|nr:hypothetical protein [Portunus trituberculatus]
MSSNLEGRRKIRRVSRDTASFFPFIFLARRGGLVDRGLAGRGAVERTAEGSVGVDGDRSSEGSSRGEVMNVTCLCSLSLFLIVPVS